MNLKKAPLTHIHPQHSLLLMQVTIDIDEYIYAFAEAKSLEQGIPVEAVLQQMLRESFPTEESTKLDLPDLPRIKEAEPISPDLVTQDEPTHKTSI